MEHKHATSHPMYSYVTDVERFNRQLEYKIHCLEEDLAALEKLVALPAEKIQKIEVRPGEDTAVFQSQNHWFRASDKFLPGDFARAIDPNYITREETFEVDIRLTLNKEQLQELQNKLNLNKWSGHGR